MLPGNVDELGEVLQTVTRFNESFAVKSAGHNPNKYFNSIAGGPLVSTGHLTEVTYDSTTSTVRVGAGNKWEDVHTVLDPLGVTVVGGRM